MPMTKLNAKPLPSCKVDYELLVGYCYGKEMSEEEALKECHRLGLKERTIADVQKSYEAISEFVAKLNKAVAEVNRQSKSKK